MSSCIEHKRDVAGVRVKETEREVLFPEALPSARLAPHTAAHLSLSSAADAPRCPHFISEETGNWEGEGLAAGC